MFENISITYSGYNGTNGNPGDEYIDIDGKIPVGMTMKAFGYKAGYAKVNYSWTGKDGCVPAKNGTGEFIQDIKKGDTSLVGVIPKGIDGVSISLTSSNDLDIQLYGENNIPIVA